MTSKSFEARLWSTKLCDELLSKILWDRIEDAEKSRSHTFRTSGFPPFVE